jgi:CBS domain-containing protein
MSLNSLIKMPNVITLSPKATVSEAAKKMAEHLVGSVIVLEGDKLVGIFTERDLLNRVVAKDLDPKHDSTGSGDVQERPLRSGRGNGGESL